MNAYSPLNEIGLDSMPDQSQLGDLCALENESALLTEHEDLLQ